MTKNTSTIPIHQIFSCLLFILHKKYFRECCDLKPERPLQVRILAQAVLEKKSVLVFSDIFLHSSGFLELKDHENFEFPSQSTFPKMFHK